MILDTRTSTELSSYKKLLRVIGSLSNLFSDSSVPYLNYRISENLFCRVFSAKNLSRSDVSADASLLDVGIGIKTFIEGNSRTIQKIAEFNKDKKAYLDKTPNELIKTIATLRNERLEATKRIHGLSNLIYHCITRKKGTLLAYDTDMHTISIDSISNIVKKENVICFQDGINEYSFNLSKSTLYKRFITPAQFIEVPVEIIKDPFHTLETLLEENTHSLVFASLIDSEHILLPLYSDRDQNVPEKSQLNQWKASGRPRDFDEVYIQIPAWIHKKFPNFFPPRDTPFTIDLPNGETISAKVCQEGSKALMSNPNKALGKWLLRDVMKLEHDEILTLERLRTIGLDSVVLYKIKDGHYSINFRETGSYDDFKKRLLKVEGN